MTSQQIVLSSTTVSKVFVRPFFPKKVLFILHIVRVNGGMAGIALSDSPCRTVESYERLNFIDEGTYGLVYKARDITSGDIYALKQIKSPFDKNGFQLTSLREITTLFSIPAHANIIYLREVVTSVNTDRFYLVMEYVDHDLLSLVNRMKNPYSPSELKSLLLQLLTGLAHLHKYSVIHRDLKLSNLLLTHDGQLKIADFGLARIGVVVSKSSSHNPPTSTSASPPPSTTDPSSSTDRAQTQKQKWSRKYTQGVVTLWYRAPEILMGSQDYSFSIDMWAVGCIFAELLLQKPFLVGQSELDQLNKIAHLLGAPTDIRWPGFSNLPNAKRLSFRNAPVESSLSQTLLKLLSCEGEGGRGGNRSMYYEPTEHTVNLIERMLEYDPEQRITAQQALQHPYFLEMPPPKHPSLIQTFPSRSSP